MWKLLEDFKKTRRDLVMVVEKFPKNRREEILFGDWSLKDILAHLNNWILHDISCLEKLKQGKEPFWEPSVESFNNRAIQRRKNNAWDEIYDEFISLGDELIEKYQKLPVNLRKTKIWDNKDFTPEKSLEVDIGHWKNHLQEIVKYSAQMGYNKVT